MMNSLKVRCACGFFLCLVASYPLWAQAATPAGSQQSCRNFVQGFYDWYIPKMTNPTPLPAEELALKYRSVSFDPELARALHEDFVASGKNSQEIVGLDFDPFLNTQDPSEKYVLGSVTLQGEGCWVEIFSIDSGKKNATPDVVSELRFKNGRWIFMNFHYGKTKTTADSNLTTILDTLRKGRLKSARRHSRDE